MHVQWCWLVGKIMLAFLLFVGRGHFDVFYYDYYYYYDIMARRVAASASNFYKRWNISSYFFPISEDEEDDRWWMDEGWFLSPIFESYTWKYVRFLLDCSSKLQVNHPWGNCNQLGGYNLLVKAVGASSQKRICFEGYLILRHFLEACIDVHV